SYRLLIDFRPKSFKSGPVSLGRRFFHGRRVPTPPCSRESAVLTRSPGRAFRSLRGAEPRAAPLHWTARGPAESRSFLRTVYTIRDELSKIDGVRVAMVGDLANGRTVRSLTYLLSKFKDIKLWFVAPPQVAMGDDLKAHLDEHHVPWVETEDLNAVLPEVDVV